MLFFPLCPFLQNLYDLLPEQDMFLVHRTVVMEVSEDPIFVFHPSAYYLQELSEVIRFVAAVYRQSDTGGSTVGDHMLTGLSDEARAYLWQSTNKGWSEKNNPYW